MLLCLYDDCLAGRCSHKVKISAYLSVCVCCEAYNKNQDNLKKADPKIEKYPKEGNNLKNKDRRRNVVRALPSCSILTEGFVEVPTNLQAESTISGRLSLKVLKILILNLHRHIYKSILFCGMWKVQCRYFTIWKA